MTLVLRPVTGEDAALIFGWRNNPEIIAHSSQRKSVNWQEHQAWLDVCLANPQVRQLLIIEHDGIPVGLIRFDRDADSEDATISIYLIESVTQRGIGTAAMAKAGDVIVRDWDIRRILAQVRSDNPRGQRFFEKAGFRLGDPAFAMAGHRLYVLALPSADAAPELQARWSAEDRNARDYYDARADRYGLDFRAVDWGSQNSQYLRFSILADGLQLKDSRILDVGCGNAEFLHWMHQQGHYPDYTGLDLSPRMLAVSKARFPDARFIEGSVDVIHGLRGERFDHVFASGIFTFRQIEPMTFLASTVEAMFSAATRSLTFNCLSGWADCKEPGEFYPDPVEVVSLCRRFTPWIVLRHDYHPGDFTVRLQRTRQ